MEAAIRNMKNFSEEF